MNENEEDEEDDDDDEDVDEEGFTKAETKLLEEQHREVRADAAAQRARQNTSRAELTIRRLQEVIRRAERVTRGAEQATERANEVAERAEALVELAGESNLLTDALEDLEDLPNASPEERTAVLSNLREVAQHEQERRRLRGSARDIARRDVVEAIFQEVRNLERHQSTPPTGPLAGALSARMESLAANARMTWRFENLAHGGDEYDGQEDGVAREMEATGPAGLSRTRFQDVVGEVIAKDSEDG